MVEQIGIGEPDWEFPIQAYWGTKRFFYLKQLDWGK